MTVEYRIEHDSMGECKVPVNALYSAQTQRAIENFPISGLPMPPSFIQAVVEIKRAAATVNRDLKLLDADIAAAIESAAQTILSGKHSDQFPIDVFQTGSGTSTNMNVNEVLAKLATTHLHKTVHPNDHINMSQSSNDVIPTAIHVSAAYQTHHELLPALDHLATTIEKRAQELQHVIKTGRTHLMDAMPVSMGQELTAWSTQIRHGIARLKDSLKRIYALAIGGTAVGTGINAHPEFGSRMATMLAETLGIPFVPNDSYFESLSAQDSAVELSGQLRVIAVSLTKIANDLRWMNSGPLAGLAEIALPSLQPGSSIMPGKVNPVIPEAICMIAAQVIGNDTTVTIAGQAGNFQLNVMLPVIAYNVLQSIQLLSNGATLLADKAIAGFTVNNSNINASLERNPILVTALNRAIGYEKGAEIAKKAYKEGRPVKEVAAEMTTLSSEELQRLLDPAELTKGGI